MTRCKPIWCKPCAQFALFWTTLAVISGYMIWRQHRESTRRWTAAAVQNTRLQARHLGRSISSRTGDLKYLLRTPALRDMRSVGGVKRLEEEFLNFTAAQKHYDQIRFIGADGREIIRVNYNAGRPAVVPKERLQDKSKRYYFRDVFKLGKGGVFISPLDLNIEHGKIERPLKPMLRIGAPVFDENGAKRGILLLNCLAKHMIDEFQEHTHTAELEPILLNDRGDWLSGSRTGDDWNFMFPEKARRNFPAAHPEVWERMKKSADGIDSTAAGLFAFAAVYPLTNQVSSTGSAKPFAPSRARLPARAYRWRLVTFVPAAALRRAALSSFNHVFIGLALLAVVGVVVCRRIKHLDKLSEQAGKRAAELGEKLERGKRFESVGFLAAGVAHDLNNAISPMLAMPALIDDAIKAIAGADTKPIGPVSEDLRLIENSSRRAADTVRDLQLLSGKAAFKKSPVDLNALVSEYLESSEGRQLAASAPHVKLSRKMQGRSLGVSGSPTHLIRVIGNLIRNAYDAVRDDKRAVIALSTFRRVLSEPYEGFETVPSGDYAVLEVSNCGKSIERDVIDRVFEPFFSRKRKLSNCGSGLGLAIVRSIARNHDGFVDAESAPETGTVFSLYLPAAGPVLPKEAEEKALPQRGSETILLADDEPAVRRVGRRALERLGYRVFAAESGQEALQMVRERLAKHPPFDLVILDMIMEEGFDGLRTYEEILKLSPNTKAIISSGYSDSERMREAVRLGAEFLPKPYRWVELGALVRRQLNRPASV